MAGRSSAQSPQQAAASTVDRHSTRIEAAGLTVSLPRADQLAFFAGIGALAFFGVLEWPVAGVLVLGHTLAQARHNTMLREFGEALEQA